MIKFETHLHNAENSSCATAKAADVAKLYIDAGYGGVIVTNHYNYFVFRELSRGESRVTRRKLIDRFLYGYRTIRERGAGLGLKVFLGAEISPYRYKSPYGGTYPGMEFLTYGFDERLLYDAPLLYELSQKELFDFVSANNCIMYQAHPFRDYCVLGDPKYMHGAEVYNKNIYHDDRDALAAAFADKHKLLKIGGSDFHTDKNEIRTGVYLPESIDTVQQFMEYAKNNELQIITATDGRNDN